MAANQDNLVLGLMSGTSLDGVDIALCKFDLDANGSKFDLIQATTVKYPYHLKEKLEDALHYSMNNLNQLDEELGEFYAARINEFLKNSPFKPGLIASHGHTVLHQPDKGITLQIGNGKIISAKTGITVVSDFRTEDVSKGGQGAPLVPIGDRDLFGEYDYCLNLGGIANISFEKGGKRIACDIVPCNMALNTVCSWIGIEYDNKGLLAESGNIDIPLLSELNSIKFYSLEPPKSLGKEWFLHQFMPVLRRSRIKIEDLLCTVNEHIAMQISGFLSGNCKDKSTVLVTGGGAFNSFLIERLRNNCSSSLLVPNNDLVNFKEALIFGYLGFLRINNKINVLSSVTGARSDSSSGVINNLQ